MKRLTTIALIAAALTPAVSNASTAMACLIKGEVVNRADQRIGPLVTLRVLEAKNDASSSRNDMDCVKGIAPGEVLRFVPNGGNFRQVDAKSNTLYVRYTYGDDRGGAFWHGMTLLTEQQYLNPKLRERLP